jgi:Xaa-Pro aminopeptidase
MEREKLAQACHLLDELNLDLWMVIDRESGMISDPVMDLVVGSGATWLSFFMVFRSGERYAVVGNLDVEKFERLELFDRVIPYKGSPQEPLLELLKKHDPKTVALDYSRDSAAADGLTYGNYLNLLDLLKNTAFLSRLVSAEPLIARLRGRKSAEELKRIRQAIAVTQDIFRSVTAHARPGMTERQLAAFMSAEHKRLGLEPAWEADHCPSVFTGPQETGAHSGPTDKPLQPGHVFNIDFGVTVDKYKSDLQRTWYLLKPGETDAPPAVKKGLRTIVESIRRSFAAMKPGARGVDIDHIAREYIVSQGFGEYPHALGHQVGRAAHDGGGLLAPAWERYGQLPFMPLERDQVYTLEPRLYLAEHGVVTIEEMVVVNADGADFLSEPQTEILLIHS